MIDINLLENNFDNIAERLKNRQTDYTNQLNEVLQLHKKRKNILVELEGLRNEKNKVSKEISKLVQDGQKVSEIDKLKVNVGKSTERIEELSTQLKEVEFSFETKMKFIPNVPYENAVVGTNEDENKEIRRWGDEFKKVNKGAHWEIAQKLNLVDFEKGVKLSGSRFIMYTGLGSKLVRAVTDILLTQHVSRGYIEFDVPLIVNREIMEGTGQLPKFEEDAYRLENDQFLIPTTEVPLTNLFANEILQETQLPIKMTGFSKSFRQEAGSAGKDTKGMIRLHQFQKVEMVKITNQDSSYEELELMVNDAENVLQLFEIPYRIIELCTGDMGFSAAKTYDLEVWFPEQNKYREISSCSNCVDFQARNMKTRYKKYNGETKFVHTLNGTGVAVDRLIATILENNFDGDKLVLPKVLRPYFNDQEFIKK